MSKVSCLFVLSLAASLGAAGASAAREPPTARVFYGDLDLATAPGAKAMLRRIRVSAESLCTPSHSPATQPDPAWTQTARCRQAAVERALVRLGAPLVTAEYDRGLGQSKIVTAEK